MQLVGLDTVEVTQGLTKGTTIVHEFLTVSRWIFAPSRRTFPILASEIMKQEGTAYLRDRLWRRTGSSEETGYNTIMLEAIPSQFVGAVSCMSLVSLTLLLVFAGWRICDLTTPYTFNDELTKEDNPATGTMLGAYLVSLAMLLQYSSRCLRCSHSRSTTSSVNRCKGIKS